MTKRAWTIFIAMMVFNISMGFVACGKTSRSGSSPATTIQRPRSTGHGAATMATPITASSIGKAGSVWHLVRTGSVDHDTRRRECCNPKYPDALKIAGRLFRLGLKDYDYGIYPDRVELTREGIDRLLMWAERGLPDE